MFETMRHRANKTLLMLFGPAQLDDTHDPMKAEDRRHAAEQDDFARQDEAARRAKGAQPR